MRALAALAAALALAGCGGGGDAASSPADTAAAATLWITRDEGAEQVRTAKIQAGESVLRALERQVPVETRYGGRFVQAILGIEGDIGRQRDWFYFVNGIEPAVGAADVEVHPGDVVWWDYRDWGEQMQAPVVVGAFPEPFLHGWDGKRRPARVVAPAALDAQAGALLRDLGGAEGRGDPNVFRLVLRPGAEGATLTATRGAADGSPVTFTLAGSQTAVGAAAAALARRPGIVRFHYVARFDDAGTVR